MKAPSRHLLSHRPSMSGAAAAMAAVLFISFIAALSSSSCAGKDFDEKSFIESFKKIHRNIYSIYKLKDEDKIYETLAKSCAGDDLEREVFEYLRCLRVQKEMETFITILQVIYNDVHIVSHDDKEAKVYCKWIVIGKVRHPTHIHRRVNLNEALYTTAFLPQGMRITGYELITNQAVGTVKR